MTGLNIQGEEENSDLNACYVSDLKDFEFVPVLPKPQKINTKADIYIPETIENSALQTFERMSNVIKSNPNEEDEG